MKRDMHANSLLAFYQGQDCFSNRQEQVLKVLRRGPATDREIMLALDRQDPNYVRPRISDLIDLGVLEQCGDKVDPVTGKDVRIVRIRPDPRQPQREFDLKIA